MRALKTIFLALLALSGATAASAQVGSGSASAAVSGYDLMIPAERPAMLRAAGFTIEGDLIFNRCGLPVDFSATNPPSVIITDINGNGRTEAILRDTGPCYAPDNNFFAIIAKGTDNRWKLIFDGNGIVKMLMPLHHGYPDAEVQLAGACKPLYRWDGERYVAIKTCKK